MSRSVYSEEYKVLREMLIDARKKAGLKQKQLSEILERANSFVCKYEIGERRLDIIELREILKTMNIDFITFMRELETRCKKL